ncbi:cyclic-guanylate-specific phosphodiesterase [Bordetella tumbae]
MGVARSRSLVVLLVIASLCIPIVGVVLISWNLALHSYQRQLTYLSESMLSRTQATLDEAKAALDEIKRYASIPCSEEHITEMRRLVANNRSIVGMGYRGENGLLKCSDYGPPKVAMPRSEAIPYVMDNGLHMIPRLATQMAGSEPRVLLYVGSNEVLVDPRNLTDIVSTEDEQLAVTLDQAGLVIEKNHPDRELVRLLQRKPAPGSQDSHVYSVAKEGPWTAIAMSPIRVVHTEFRKLLFVMLPIALVISVLFIFLGLGVIRKRASIEGRLATAVKEHAFTVHYQPIIDIRTGACVGAEALARWPQPNGEYIAPDIFIPQAEKNALIFSITDQVIETVVRDMAEALRAEKDLHISINVSAADMSSGRVLSVLRRLLAEASIPSEQIWLEATERGLMDVESARQSIQRAHTAGHSVALDDFGTGYSSLTYLEALPIDMIKIDRSFVATIGQVTAKSPVLPHIIDMAKTLNLRCIAEGVETEVQLEYLTGKGIEFAQGWYFSKPLPAAEFIAFLAQPRADARRAY